MTRPQNVRTTKKNRKVYPLLDEEARPVLITSETRYPDILELTLAQDSQLWSAVECEFKNIHIDRATFRTLDPAHQQCIKTILLFFSLGDELVLDNLNKNFTDIKINEIQEFYSRQVYIEFIHSRTYGDLFAGYVPDLSERTAMLQCKDSYKCVQVKRDWMKKHTTKHNTTNTDRQLGLQLVTWGAAEGLLFAASFAVIGYFKHRGINLPTLIAANEFIARDERLHTDASIAIFQHVVDKPPSSKILSIITDAVEVELQYADQVVCFGTNITIEGVFNRHNMGLHIKHIANDLAKRFGCLKRPYPEVDGTPFTFMSTFGVTAKTNFFEAPTTVYSRRVQHTTHSGDNEQLDYNNTLAMDEDY